jgi:hypothetical protein
MMPSPEPGDGHEAVEFLIGVKHEQIVVASTSGAAGSLRHAQARVRPGALPTLVSDSGRWQASCFGGTLCWRPSSGA